MPTRGMITDSLQVKRRAIAYLYQMVPALQRNDNMSFYEEITKHGVDLPEIMQQPHELALLKRTVGSPEQLDEVRVGAIAAPVPMVPGGMVPAAFRCLIAEQGSSRPLKLFVDLASTIHEAFGHVWGGRAGRLQLVEVAFVATVSVEHPEGAPGFLKEYVTRTAQHVTNHLGRNFDGLSVKFTSNPVMQVGPGGPAVPLVGAHVELTLEPFLQDIMRQLFVNLAVKWPAMQFRLSDLQVPAEARAALGNKEFVELNVDPREPSSYIEQVSEYMEHQVLPFISAVSR